MSRNAPQRALRDIQKTAARETNKSQEIEWITIDIKMVVLKTKTEKYD